MTSPLLIGQVPYATAETQVLRNTQQLEALGFKCHWTDALTPEQLQDSTDVSAHGYQWTTDGVMTTCQCPGMRFDIYIDHQAEEVAIYGEPHVSSAHYQSLNRYIFQMRKQLALEL